MKIQVLLEAIKRLGEKATPERIAGNCGVSVDEVHAAASLLRGKGFIKAIHEVRYVPTEAGRKQLKEGVLGRSKGQSPRGSGHQGIREAAWWQLRANGTVIVHDVLLTHSEDGAGEEGLLTYFRALARGGVVERVKVKRDGKELSAWKLVKDLGRIAPTYRAKHHEFFDPNAKKFIKLPVRGKGGDRRG